MKYFKSAVASAFVLLCATVQAQDNSVGINTNSPNTNAVLELVSPNSDQGFLVPRVTSSQRTSMASSLGNADDGLMVFDTDVNLFYYWNNNNWSAGLGVLNVLAAGGDLTGNYPNPTIKLGAVVEDRLGDLAVSTAKLQNSSVTTGKIDNGAVTTDKIANEAVTGSKLEDVGITPGTYGNQFTVLQLTADSKGRVVGVVETPILITSTHITDLSIVNQDIADGTITISKIDSDGNSDKVLTIDGSGQVVWADRADFTSSSLARDNIYIGNGSGIAEGLPVTGDVTVVNTGTAADVQLRTESVTSNEIQNGGVESVDIANDAVTSAKINNGDVQTIDIANDAVNNSKLADNAVNTENITDGQVQTADIANLNVTTDKINNDAVTAAKINADVAGTGLQQNGTTGALEADFGNLANTLAGDGLVDNVGTIDVNVDGSTLETNADVLRVRAEGITANEIATGAVNTDEIADGQVQTADLADLNVTTGKLAADAVDNSKLADNAVNTENIVDGQVQTADIADLNVTTGKLAADAVDNTKLADNAVNTENITDGQVQTADVADLNITTGKLAADAVDNTKLADNAVNSENITDGQVQTADIANLNVTTEKINDDAVTASKINADVAGTGLQQNGTTGALEADFGNLAGALAGDGLNDDLADGDLDVQVDESTIEIFTNELRVVPEGITANEIATSAVTTDEILDATIATNDIAIDAIENSLIADNAIQTENILDGEVQTADIADLNVTTGKLAADAVDNSKLANDAVNTENITDGQVQTNDIADLNVTTIKLAADAVDNSKLANNAVNTENIRDGEVQTDDIADLNVTTGKLAADAVDNSKIADNAINTENIRDGEVQTADIGDLNVTTAKINNDAVTAAKINSDVAGTGLTQNGTTGALEADFGNLAGALAGDGLNDDLADGDLDVQVDGSTIEISANDLRVVPEGITANEIATGAVNSDEIANGTIADVDLDKTNIPLSGFGAATADVDLGNNKLVNVADPTLNQDAATKNYVDTEISTETSALQAELDATQAGAGLGTDGTYTPNAGTNYITTSSSIVDATEDLDTQVATNAGAIATEVTDRTNADAAIQTELDATQGGAGLATDGTYTPNAGTNYITTSSSIVDATEDLDTQVATNAGAIATEVTDRTNADAAIQTELDATQGGAGLGTDGTYTPNAGTNYITTSSSIVDATEDLDTQVAANAAAISAGNTALQAELDATQAGAGLGTDGTYTPNAGTNYITTSSSIVDATEDLDTQVATNAGAIATEVTDRTNADAAIQTELDATQGGAGLATDGTYTPNAGTNYITTSSSIVDATEDLDTQVATNAGAIATEVTDRTNADAAIQTELDATQGGAGLGTDGTYTPNAGTNYITTSSSIVDATEDLDTQVAANAAAISAGNTALQAELDATQAGAGLGTDGTYTPNAGTNYITTSSSIVDATEDLDTQVATNAGAIATEVTDRTNADAAIQTELDATQGGAGLATDGTYTPNAGTNYITTSSSIVDATEDLDTQVAANAAAISAGNTALQAELDATQAGAGLGTDGTYTPNAGTNYITTSSSIVDATEDLDTQVATNAGAIATEITDRTNADAAIQTELDATQGGAGLGTDGTYTPNAGTNYITTSSSIVDATEDLDTQVATNAGAIATEVTDRTNADAAIQTELDATQGGAGLATDGTYTPNAGTNYITTSSSIVDATEDLDTQVAANAAAISAGNTALQAELDATQAGAGLGTDGTYTPNAGTNYITTSSSIVDATEDLDTQVATNAGAIATEITDRTNADAAIQTELDATQGGAGLGTDGTYTPNAGTNYITTSSSIVDATEDLDTQVAANAAAISAGNTALQAELDATQAGAGLGTDGTYTPNAGTNYITTSSSIVDATEDLDTQVAANAGAIATEVTDRTNADAAIQTELDATQGGAGLATDGTYTPNAGTNYITTSSSIVDATEDLDTQVAANAAAISAGNTALQAELDATQAGAGLGTDGTYTPNAGTNYITTSSSIVDATEDLDTQVAANAGAIATEVTDRTNADAAIQTELDATQGGAGLATDGTYTPNAGTNYITTSSSIVDATEDLDTQVAANAAAISAGNTAIQSELDATQGGAGLATDGTYTPNAGTNYITTSSSIVDATEDLDTQVATNAGAIATEITDRTNADAAIQTELDATQGGAGLGTDGTYTPNAGTNYITTSSSIVDATEDLDTQVAANAAAISAGNTALQAELDATQAGAGLGTDGTYTPNAGTNYITTSSSIVDATEDLDTQVATNAGAIATEVTDRTNADAAIQTELDATQGGAGLAADGTYTPNAGTNYITTSSSIVDATEDLDTQVATNAGAIATEVTDRTNADAAIQTELDATQGGAGLGTDGTYTPNAGTNYITTSSSIVDATEDLDTQVAANAAAISAGNTAIQSELDATQGGAGLAADGTYTPNAGTNYITTSSSIVDATEDLDTQVAANAGAIATEVTDRTNADAAIQTELDATQGGAGLAADGTYTPNAGTNYITTSSSIVDATEDLDTQVAANAAAISAGNTAIQSELDATQGGAGLAADGTYTPNAGTNYITTSSSIVDATEDLDTQVAANAAAISAGNTAIQSELDATQGGAGLATDGTYTPNAGTNYITTSSSIVDATEDLDTQVAANAAAISAGNTAIQSELDATQGGAGLAADGTYTPNAGTNYITTSSSIVDATEDLDTQVATNAGAIATEVTDRTNADAAIQTELDATQGGAGLATDGTYTPNAGTNYITTSSSIVDATEDLDTQVAANAAAISAGNTAIQSELDATQGGAGLATDGTYTPNAGTNYITTSSSIVDATEDLDTQVAANAAAISAGNTAIQSELDATQGGAGLGTDGTYTPNAGTNYITTSSSIVDATEDLDTQVAANAAAISAGNTAIQSELDATQGGAGLAADGTYTPNAGTNYITTSSSIVDATEDLDTQVATNAGAIATEVTDRTNADAAIQTELDATQGGAGLATDGTYTPNAGTNYITTSSSIVDATEDLDTQVAANAAAISAGNTAIQSELDATQGGAGLGTDGTYTPNAGTNYITTSSSIVDATEDLDTQVATNAGAIATEVTDRTNADAAIQTELDATQGGAGLATDGTYTPNAGTNYITTSSSIVDATEDLDTQVAANAAAISAGNTAIQSELDATQGGAGLGTDGTYTPNAGTNYITTSSSIVDATEDLDTQVAANAAAISAGNTAIQSELDATQGGAGLAADGTYTPNAGTNYITTSSSIVDATEDLDTQVATNAGAIATEVTDRTNADAAIQTELDATQGGAGLATDGTYTPNAGTNYITTSSSIVDATEDLDTQVAANAAAISAGNTAIQSELDATQGGAGLAADGTYTPNAGTNYITTSSSIVDATEDLDTQVAANAAAISAGNTAIQSELDATQGGAGLAADGTYTPNAGTNYITTSSSIVDATEDLDTQVATNAGAIATEVTDRTNADAAIQTELDATQGGAGLAADGTYTPNAGTNYITTSSSIVDATEDLDTQVAANAAAISAGNTAIQSELDATQGGAGLAADGTYTPNAGTNYITTSSSIVDATEDLDTQVAANAAAISAGNTAIQSELDATQGGAGLGTDGTYTPNAGTNYITTSSSIVDATEDLDTQVATNAGAIATEVTDRTNADAAIQTELDATQGGAGLAADGTYTPNAGTNYITTSSSIVDATEDLDTQVAANAAAISAGNTAIQTELDATQGGAGLGTDGTYTPNAGTNYITTSSSIVDATEDLDTQVAANAAAISAGNTALQAELDATQAGAGLGTDGTYTPNAGTNYITTSSSIVDATEDLDTQVAANAAAISAGNTAIQSELDATQGGAGLAADGTYTPNAGTNYITTSSSIVDATEDLDTQVAANAAAISAGNTAIQSELDATQGGAGLAADGTYTPNAGTNYITTSSSIVDATEDLDTQVAANAGAIATEVTDRTNADAAIQTELDATQGGAGLGTDGTYTPNAGTNYITTSSSIVDATEDLDTQVAANAAAISAGNTAIQSELDATQGGAGLAADGTYTPNAGTNYITTSSSIVDATEDLDTQVAANAAAISAGNTAIQSELDATQGGAGLGTDGTYTPNAGTNYITTSSSIVDATEDLDTQVAANAGAIATEVTDRTNADAAIQSELDATQGGAGLGTDGTYTPNAGTNYITTSSSIVDATEDLDTQVAANAAAISAGNTAIQSELDATQGGAGLAADGTYTPNAGTNYITTSSSIVDATEDLDTQVAANAGAIATEVTDRTNADAAIQTELDATQGGAGLGTDGTYTPNAGTNYITTSSSIVDATEDLDTQVAANAAAISAGNTAIQSELDATQGGAGLAADGTYTPNAGTNYITTSSSIVDATEDLDTQVAANAAAISAGNTAIQSELDATQGGAGLAADGTYTPNAGTNYITTSSSIVDATEDLDTQVAANAGAIATEVTDRTNADAAIQTELDATQGGAGLGTDGTYTPNAGTNYITTSSSIVDATEDLDTQVAANAAAISAGNTAIQSELDATQGGAGLAADGTYTPNAGTNYITTSSSIVDATEDLDTQVATNAGAIATEVTDRTNADAAIQTELDATQGGAGLGTDGTYTPNAGTNYITTSSSIVDATEDLDTQVAANAAAISAGNTAIQSELDATQGGAGLAADGTYTPNAGTNYITTSSSIVDATEDLDTQVAANAAAISAGNTAIQSELDATQGGAGLATDGTYTPNAGTNYITTSSSIVDATEDLDTQVATNAGAIATEVTDRTNADAAIQTELDATQGGAGLGTDGTYTPNAGTNYITTSSSIVDATEDLDTQVAANAAAISAGNTAIQSELDATQGGAGLAADGTYTPNAGTNYITTSSSIVDATEDLDTQVAANAGAIATEVTDRTNADAAIQTELDATQGGAGLGTDGTYTPNAGTNYITTSSSIVDATEDLDTQVAANAAAISAGNTAIQSELDATQGGAGLGTDGTYTPNAGTNYITTSSSIVDATEDLDTQVATNAGAIAGKQNSDPDLDIYAGITPSTDVQAALGAANDASLRTEIGLAIGSDVQAYDAGLADIAGLTPTDNNIVIGNGTNFVTETGATARTSLGLAIGADVQAYDADLDTYAGITPSTDVQAALGAADDASLRTEIGLAIGSDVQAYDAGLADIAGLTPTDNNIVIGNGTNFVTETGATARTSLGLAIGSDVQAYDADLDTYAGITPSTDVQAALGAANDAALRTEIGLGIGTNVQAYDADLDTYAGITPSTDVQAALGAANDAALRTEIGLAIGSDVQAYDAGLADIAGLTPTDNNIVIGNGTNFVTETGATARTSLGLAIGADVQAYDADLDTYAGITPSTDVQAALGAADDASLRTEIGLAIGSDVQAYDAGLADIAGLTPTDNNIVIGNGTNFVTETGATARTSLGLAIGADVQAYDADLDTYAGITPSTDVQAALGAANDATLRTEIGLGIGTNVQAYDADLDTYAGITPSTDVQAALGAADDASLRTEIGLAIGSDVQAYDAGLADIAGLTPTDNNIVIGNGTNFVTETGATARTSLGLAIGADVQAYDADLDTYAGITPSTDVQAALGAANDAALRTEIGLGIGTNVQAYDADLDTYAGITPSTDVQAALGAADDASLRTEIGLAIGSDVQAYDSDLDTYAGITPSTDVQAALGAADDASLRTEIGLAIGSDVQAYDAGLADIAGLTPTDNNIVIGNGTNFVTETGATARTSLGLAIGADVQAYDADLDTYAGITPSTDVQAALGAADDASLRTEIGLAIGSDVQAYDAGLADIAGLTPTDNNIVIGNGTNFVTETGATARTSLGLAIGSDVQAYDADLDTYAGITPSTDVQAALGAANDAALRTEIGLGIGTNVQAYDADLDTYAGITPSTDVQAALGAANDAALRTEIGLGIGTNVQAYDADLDTYAGITPSTDVQAALGAANDAALRTEIGLGIGTNVQAYDADLDTYAGITPSTDVQAALGAADDASLRTEIGLGSLATLSTVTSTEITNSTIQFADMATNGATANGDIMEWNGSAWVIGTDDVSSDERLKKDIIEIPEALARVLEIKGVNYYYRTEEFAEKQFSKKLQYGVIAQDLLEVFPELVSKSADGYYQVNYKGLIPVLVQAMQEQQTQIENLNEKVADQEQKLSELASDNKEMKGDLDLIKKMLLGDQTVKEDKE